MILKVVNAEYKGEYKISLTFNIGDSLLVDLEQVLLNDPRKIFLPLRDLEYFKKFKIYLNTITWDNEADFAPEFLNTLGKTQQIEHKVY